MEKGEEEGNIGKEWTLVCVFYFLFSLILYPHMCMHRNIHAWVQTYMRAYRHTYTHKFQVDKVKLCENVQSVSAKYDINKEGT